MRVEMRKTGIDIIDEAPWGTHLCQFYQTKEDLVDILVPYFKTGLENNEFCMWVTSEPLGAKDAKASLSKVVKNLDDYIRKGQLEILAYNEWYTKTGRFERDKVLEGWVDKEREALKRGFAGLRLTGNTFWLEGKDWRDFVEYEKVVNSVIGNYKMIAICSYSLEKCRAADVIDVVSNHRYALIRRQGKWEPIESSERKRVEEEKRAYVAGIENAYEGIAFTKMNGDMLYFNKAACKIFGYTPAEMKEINISKFSATSADRKKLEESVREKGRFSGEIMGVRKNRETFPATLSVSIVKDDEGKPIGRMGVFTDITERERAEETLRESEEFRSSLLNNSPHPVVVIEVDTSVGFVNPALERLTGFSSAELIGRKAPYPWWTEETLQKTDKDFREALRKRARRIEELFQKKNGERFWVEITATPVISDGEFKYYLASWIDITERKRAEEALRLERDRLTSILDSMEDGVYIGGPEHEVEYTNPALKAQFGPAEGRHCYQYFNDRTELCPSCPYKTEPEKTVRREWYSFKTEKTYDLLSTPLRNTDGSISHLVTFRDITEHKQANEALRESEANLAEAQQIARLGSWEVDLKTNERQWSDELFHIMGIDRQKHRPSHEIFVSCVHPDDRGSLEVKYQAALNGHEPYSDEFRVVLPDGSVRIVRTEGKIIRDQSGQLDRFIGTAQDITERKKREEKERELQQELYLSGRLASIGRLAAGVAHEINNPLTGILGFSERVLRKSTDETAIKDLERIHHEAGRAARVVQNLLTFARRHEPRKEYSDINSILQKALELRAYELKTSNIEVALNLAPDLPPAMVDFSQIEEVFLNLILNAEQAITEAYRAGKLGIKTQRMKSYIRISFADDGPGIPAEHLDKLFDPFFTTRGERGGTGLGLSLCHGIVTEHGGRIYAKSKPGVGATFFVELPVTT